MTTGTTGTTDTTSTPVIAGFHPDPSVCVVGDDLYLATSSFEYHPGVPIFHSTDLLHWKQVGHVLTRESQHPFGDGRPSGGIYAPTLRHHDGGFWMVTTDTSAAEPGQRIYRSAAAAGPWSDPVLVTAAPGIDPDLAWDDDRTCLLTWCAVGPAGHSGSIRQAALDPATGELQESPRSLWSGTGMGNPEAPHLYRRGDWWYLLIAEGGTERGHSVSIARSRSPRGPFDGFGGNPILSHRSSTLPVQNTGHGDLVRLPDGSWALVFLGVRPHGVTPHFHVNGRETFVAGIDWVDGWPVVDESRYRPPAVDHSFLDTFESAELDPRWVAPGALPTAFATRADPAGLRLVPAEPGVARRNILAARTRDRQWRATARLDLGRGAARVLLRLDDDHWYAVRLSGGHAWAEASVRSFAHSGAPVAIAGPAVTAWIDCAAPEPGGAHQRPLPGPDTISLGVETDRGPVTLGEFDGRYLSTEVAGGFTGRVVGIEPLSGAPVLRSFRYEAR